MGVAATRTQKARVPGAERRTVTEVTLDNSYAEGGEPLTAKQLGLRSVDHAICSVKTPGAGQVVSATYDIASEKLKAFAVSGGKEAASKVAEAAKEADLSTTVIAVEAFGH